MAYSFKSYNFSVHTYYLNYFTAGWYNYCTACEPFRSSSSTPATRKLGRGQLYVFCFRSCDNTVVIGAFRCFQLSKLKPSCIFVHFNACLPSQFQRISYCLSTSMISLPMTQRLTTRCKNKLNRPSVLFEHPALIIVFYLCLSSPTYYTSQLQYCKRKEIHFQLCWLFQNDLATHISKWQNQ